MVLYYSTTPLLMQTLPSAELVSYGKENIDGYTAECDYGYHDAYCFVISIFVLYHIYEKYGYGDHGKIEIDKGTVP